MEPESAIGILNMFITAMRHLILAPIRTTILLKFQGLDTRFTLILIMILSICSLLQHVLNGWIKNFLNQIRRENFLAGIFVANLNID